MPRYFFNVTEERQTERGRGHIDDVGSELADLGQARCEALATLSDISKGKLEEDGDRRFIIEVHEGHGPVLFRASLVLKLEYIAH
jgi:hypothetical protein